MAVDPKQADKERIRSLLFKVGDVRKKVVGNMRGLVSLLQEDMADHRETILSSFIECAKYLPTKPGIVGTALALLNQNNRVFVADVVNGMAQELYSALARKDHAVCICLLRVFVECANSGCLPVDEVISFLSTLLSFAAAAGYKEGSFGVFAVLSAIPYISPELSQSNTHATAFISSAIQTAEGVLVHSYQQRRNIVGAVSDTSDELEEAIACVKSFQSCGWTSDTILRPYLMDGLKEQLVSKSPIVHALPASLAHVAQEFSRQNTFIPSCLPRLASAVHGADGWLLRDILRLTCILFKDSVGECAKALLRVPVEESYFEPILAEVLLDLSVHSPTINNIPRLFYTSTLQRCIVLQESLKGPTEQAVFTLLSKPLKSEAQVMLAETISFLVNSNVKLDLAQLQSVNTPVFSKVMECLARIMFANSIQTKIPEPMHAYILPDAATSGNAFPEDQDYSMVKQVVRIKDGSAVEVTQVLSQIDETKKGVLLARAIVENGSRTVTHFVRLIDIYRSICESVVPKSLMAETLFEFWGTLNNQRLERYIEICLRENLIDAVSVAKLIDINGESISSYRVVEIVFQSLLRCSKTIGSNEEALTVILDKSDQTMTEWIVKNYYMQLDSRDTKSGVLELFK